MTRASADLKNSTSPDKNRQNRGQRKRIRGDSNAVRPTACPADSLSQSPEAIKNGHPAAKLPGGNRQKYDIT
jgi:hypothetical protein